MRRLNACASCKISVFGTAILFGSVLLAACGPTPDTSKPASTASPTAAATSTATPRVQTPEGVGYIAGPTPASTPTPKPATPQYGGVLTLPTDWDPTDLNPFSQTSVRYFAVFGQGTNQLAEYTPDGRLEVTGDIAEKWTVSGDGTVYTFNLRNGVKWHDGQPLTARDVKYTLDTFRTSAMHQGNLQLVQKVEAVDDNTVAITLSGPQASFIYTIALGTMPIVPQHVPAATLQTKIVGTGPFKLKAWEKGLNSEFERNDAYLNSKLPYLDGVRRVMLRDEAAQIAAFRTGRIHLFDSILPMSRNNFELIKKDITGAQGILFDTQAAFMIQINSEKEPFADQRVRRAISLAMDRWASIDALGDGLGEPAVAIVPRSWLLPRDEILAMPGMAKGAAKQKERDEAKRLLKEAGFPNGFKTSVLTNSVEPFLSMAEYAVDQLKAVGLDASTDVREYAVVTEAKNKGAFDMAVIRGTLDVPDPDGAWRTIGVRQFSNLKDTPMFDLFQKQKTELNQQARKEIVWNLQRRIAEVVPYIALSWDVKYLIAAPQVREVYAPLTRYNRFRFDQVWLAK